MGAEDKAREVLLLLLLLLPGGLLQQHKRESIADCNNTNKHRDGRKTMSFIGRLVLLGVGRMVAGGKLTSGCCISF